MPYIKNIHNREMNFFNSRIDLLKMLEKKDLTLAKLHKHSFTYSHIVKVVKHFEEKKLVTTEKIGRERIVHLTNLGRELILDKNNNKLLEVLGSY